MKDSEHERNLVLGELIKEKATARRLLPAEQVAKLTVFLFIQ